MRKMANDANKAVDLDSAGVGPWHVGQQPDKRARAAAEERGYDTDGIVARQIQTDDYRRFDVIYAMAKEHEQFLRQHAPPDATAEITLFLRAGGGVEADVPDPYYDTVAGFEQMMDLLEQGCAALLDDIK